MSATIHQSTRRITSKKSRMRTSTTVTNSYLVQWLLDECWLHISPCWRSQNPQHIYEGGSKIFRTDAVKIINLTTKRVWKLPTSTQLRATWHNSLDMVVLPYTGASRYHNYCIDGGTSPEYFGYTFVSRTKSYDRPRTSTLSAAMTSGCVNQKYSAVLSKVT
jgi:hypothetical protein